MTVAPDERTRIKGLEVEGIEVETAVELGVCGEGHLESPVEKEAIYVIGADASTDGFAGFEHDDR